MFVFDAQQHLLCVAEPAQIFAFFGADGARAQAQRHRVLKRHLRDLRSNTVRLDLPQAMQRRTTLADPAPTVLRGPRIALTQSNAC